MRKIGWAASAREGGFADIQDGIYKTGMVNTHNNPPEQHTDELVSVLMPVYKPDFGQLREAIKSILGQDYDNLELVIVEDPSPKPGRELVESFGDPRIRYHLNEARSSLKDQLNLGITMCRSEYVARMDADDVSRPSRIGNQLRFLKAHPEVSVVGTNLELIDVNGATLGYRRLPERHEDIFRDLRLYCSIAHPTVMFRKSVVEGMGCYQAEAPMEDWDLWCRIALSGKRLHNLQEPLFRYRVHPQAGKITSMKKSIRTGIELKERHFRNGPGTWGFRERLRCSLERVLMILPPSLVLWLFFAVTLRKRP